MVCVYRGRPGGILVGRGFRISVSHSSSSLFLFFVERSGSVVSFLVGFRGLSCGSLGVVLMTVISGVIGMWGVMQGFQWLLHVIVSVFPSVGFGGGVVGFSFSDVCPLVCGGVSVVVADELVLRGVLWGVSPVGCFI